MNFALLMAAQNAENKLFYAFMKSDAMGQGIVILLLGFSVVTWCVMLIKWLGLHQGYQESKLILADFRKRRNAAAMRDVPMDEEAPVTNIFKAGWRRMCNLRGSEEMLRRNPKPFSETETQIIRTGLDEAIADQIIVLEKKIIFLQTAVSISPFLGLFGTVWGIMLAFTEMAIQGKPDVATLAPGVSGALLTTVLGLVVAIPSLIGYNVISEQVKNMTVVMDNFADEFISKINLERVITESGNGELLQNPPMPQTPYQRPPVTQYQQQAPRPQYQAPAQTQYQAPRPAPQPQYQAPAQTRYQAPRPAPQPQYQAPAQTQYQQPVAQPQTQAQYRPPVQQQPAAPAYQAPSADGGQPSLPGTDRY